MIYFDAAYIAKCYLNEPGADRALWAPLPTRKQLAFALSLLVLDQGRPDELRQMGRSTTFLRLQFDKRSILPEA